MGGSLAAFEDSSQRTLESDGSKAHNRINLPGVDLLEATDWCGLHSGKQTDKSKVFATFSGELEDAPMIKACRLSAECRLIKTVKFPVDTVYFGEVVCVHLDESALLQGGALGRSHIAPLFFSSPDKSYRKMGAVWRRRGASEESISAENALPARPAGQRYPTAFRLSPPMARPHAAKDSRSFCAIFGDPPGSIAHETCLVGTPVSCKSSGIPAGELTRHYVDKVTIYDHSGKVFSVCRPESKPHKT